MKELAAVILAAGLGTRMRSSRAKVLHSVAGRPMIEYPVALARSLGSKRLVCVLGHQAETVREAIDQRFGADAVEVVLQREQKGTGHALQQTAPLLSKHTGPLLVLYGDVPLLTEATLRRLLDAAAGGKLALVTTRPPIATGYGRIVRDGAGRLSRIVEEKDASSVERSIGEVNAGIYCGDARFFFDTLGTLGTDNAQNEIYLTDIAERAAQAMGAATVEAPCDEVMGVNDRVDLARADQSMRWRLAEALMRDGVTVRDPARLFVEPGVAVGRDSELGPGVELRGRTVIGARCRLEAGVIVTDSSVADDVHIKPYCVITESTIGEGAKIGPWAHLRPGTVLEPDVHLGNFVETKKTHLGRGAKANHLSYLGDADIGARVNVGCGTITCNYDGYAKYRTVIEEGAFIGSDTQLVAPVTVGRGAVVGAGTTVYEDVPPGALALTRSKQIAVKGYAERKRKQMDGAAKDRERAAKDKDGAAKDKESAAKEKEKRRHESGLKEKDRGAKEKPKPSKQRKSLKPPGRRPTAGSRRRQPRA